MSWRDYRARIAIALWAAVFVLLAPAAYHLYSYVPAQAEEIACYPEFNPEYYDEESYEAQYLVVEQEFRENLASSEDSSAQLMSIRVENNGRVGADEIDVLAELAQRAPESGLVVSQLLAACLQDPGRSECSSDSVNTLVQSHSNNSAIWGSLAMLRNEQEDIFGAISALRQAAVAPEFDDYFSLQVAVIDQANPTAEPLAKMGTAFRFFSYSDPTVGTSSAGPSIWNLCSQQASVDPLAAEGCLLYGERIAEGSDTNIGKILGLAVQQGVYQAIGDEDGVARMEAALEARQEYQNQFRSPAMSLMSYDEELADFWINSLIEHGEVETMERLHNEVQRLTANPEYQPCDPPGLRFDYPYFYIGDERVIW
ncbi:MAG: hypothetical protein RIC17_14660 [Gammaproteobacteria bacterium]